MPVGLEPLESVGVEGGVGLGGQEEVSRSEETRERGVPLGVAVLVGQSHSLKVVSLPEHILPDL